MKKIWLIVAIMLSALLLLVGCGKETTNSSSTMKTVTYEGTKYEVPQNPQRVATLSNSLLYMVYELGGTAVSRPLSMDKMPANMQKVPTIGHTAHINTEKLLGLKPDLVLGIKPQNNNIAAVLDSNKIPHMLVSYEGINDNIPLLEALGKVLNKEKKAQEEIAKYKSRVSKVKAAVASQKPATVAVLFASGRSITAETNKSITASMVQELGMKDVVAQHIPKNMSKSKTIPYSLETLSIDNPDIILIVTMGKRSQIDEQMKKSFTDNPAWNNLKAVKNGKVFYLPSNLFLLNPGLKTPEAMAELVKDVYGINVKF